MPLRKNIDPRRPAQLMQDDRLKLFAVCKFPAYEPFSKQQILDSSKVKEFPDDNLNVDKNGNKFFK